MKKGHGYVEDPTMLSRRAKRLLAMLADIDVLDALRRHPDFLRKGETTELAVARDIPVKAIMLARKEVDSWPETKRKRKQKGW